MTDVARILHARRVVVDAALGRSHVASRLLAERVSLNWDIAVEAALRLATLEEENRDLRRLLRKDGVDD